MYDTIGFGVSTLIAQLTLKLLVWNDSVKENDQVALLVPGGYLPFLSAKAEESVFALIARVLIFENIYERSECIDMDELNHMAGKIGARDAWTIDAVKRALVDRIRLDAATINAERPTPKHWNLCEEFRSVVNMEDPPFNEYLANALERMRFYIF